MTGPGGRSQEVACGFDMHKQRMSEATRRRTQSWLKSMGRGYVVLRRAVAREAGWRGS